MTDNMRFAPDRIEVRQGETVRLVPINYGQVRHEFVLGSKMVGIDDLRRTALFPHFQLGIAVAEV